MEETEPEESMRWPLSSRFSGAQVEIQIQCRGDGGIEGRFGGVGGQARHQHEKLT